MVLYLVFWMAYLAGEDGIEWRIWHWNGVFSIWYLVFQTKRWLLNVPFALDIKCVHHFESSSLILDYGSIDYIYIYIYISIDFRLWIEDNNWKRSN